MLKPSERWEDFYAAVLRLEGCAVHSPRKQHVLPHRLLHRQAALVILLDAAFGAMVMSREHNLARVVTQASFLEHRAQRDARPVGRTDRTAEPRLTDWPRLQVGPTVTGALECHTQGAGRTPLEVRQTHAERPLHLSADGQSERGDVNVRYVVMREGVMQAGRRAAVSKRLER